MPAPACVTALVALDAVHPAAQANVLRTAELLREESSCSTRWWRPSWVTREHRDRASEPAAPALRRLMVIRLAEQAGGRMWRRRASVSARSLRSARGARGGRAELHVGGLAGAVIEDGELRMIAIQPREQH